MNKEINDMVDRGLRLIAHWNRGECVKVGTLIDILTAMKETVDKKLHLSREHNPRGKDVPVFKYYKTGEDIRPDKRVGQMQAYDKEGNKIDYASEDSDYTKPIESIEYEVGRKGVHLSHCYQGENEWNCKYGYQGDECPAYKPYPPDPIRQVRDKWKGQITPNPLMDRDIAVKALVDIWDIIERYCEERKSKPEKLIKEKIRTVIIRSAVYSLYWEGTKKHNLTRQQKDNQIDALVEAISKKGR